MKISLPSLTATMLATALGCSEPIEPVKLRDQASDTDYTGDGKVPADGKVSAPVGAGNGAKPGEPNHSDSDSGSVSDSAPVESSELCDGRSLHITQGKLVNPDSVMALSTVKIRFESNIFCTGTLVGPRQVITAAHCLKGEMPTEARFGTDPDKNPEHVAPIKSWIIHPDYGNIYDVAVVLLKDPVPAKFLYAPIAKPKTLKLGSTIYFAGYGSTSEESKTASNPLAWTSVPLEVINTERKTFSTAINGKGSCYGDSGGPGYVMDSKNSCLLAIGVVNTASTKGNGLCGQGDTSLDLTQVQGWVGDSFKILSAPLPYEVVLDGTEAAVSRNILGTR